MTENNLSLEDEIKELKNQLACIRQHLDFYHEFDGEQVWIRPSENESSDSLDSYMWDKKTKILFRTNAIYLRDKYDCEYSIHLYKVPAYAADQIKLAGLDVEVIEDFDEFVNSLKNVRQVI